MRTTPSGSTAAPASPSSPTIQSRPIVGVENRVRTIDGMPTITHNTAGGFTQTQGHHRVAAAAEIERTTGRNVWLPVNYGHGPMYVYPSDAKRINVSEV